MLDDVIHNLGTSASLLHSGYNYIDSPHKCSENNTVVSVKKSRITLIKLET